MAETYITVDGDMVDLIAYRFYGDEGGTVAIHSANPGLAEQGFILAGGLTIIIPDWRKPNSQTNVASGGLDS